MLEKFLHSLGIPDTGIQSRSEGAAFLKVARSLYPINQIVYIGVNIPIGNERARFLHCTYSDRWLKHSTSRGPITGVQTLKLSALFPSEIRWGHGAWSEQHANGDADTRWTVSIPLRVVHGELAALYVEGNGITADTALRKGVIVAELQALGNYFHQHMLRICGQAASKEMLVSARELDCLKWMAVGKTAWEASVILGISERTVRFHLNAAREKLDCLTTTQAVAKAVAQQLIVV